MVYLNRFILIIALTLFIGCGTDTTEPGVEPDVLSCGDWGVVEYNQCGGVFARSCNIDGRKCLQIFDCYQRYWDCQ